LKKKISLIVLITLALSLLAAAYPARAQQPKWTIMVYMDADNNLDLAGLDDLFEMQMVGSSEDVNVVVLFDRWGEACGFNGTILLHIEKNTNTTIWGEWSSEYELNMGDPETLKWFINFTIEQYPAEKYALILWDHGGNWEGICWDWTNDDYLTIEEVKMAILESRVDHIDLLGFDACLMASIEVAYTMGLTSKIDVMVASEEFIPWDGWPYDLILNGLTENPEWSTKDLSVHIVDNYIASYSHGTQGFAWYATLSAINLTEIDALAHQMADLTTTILADFNKYKSAVTGAKNSAERYWFGFWHQGAYIDLCQFILVLGKINDKLTPYTAPILKKWDDIVIHAGACDGPHARSANGITIYFPRNRNLFYTPEPYYNSVPEFAKVTRWYEFLTTYFSK
jgi:hypothetical protein